MAKRRKKSTTGKRRKVSGVKDLDLQSTGLAILGAVGAFKLAAMIKKDAKPDSMREKAAPYAGLIAGIAIAMFVKNPIAKSLSVGLAAGGGVTALNALAPDMKILSGPYQLPVISGRRRLNGGVMNPNAVGNGFTPARNSVNDTLSVISGTTMNGTAMGM